ncbi:hypothetical protein C1I64_19475 [Rathayibacter festucae DSM 15932]|uniref:UDP-N-acetylglucosamine kinase n=1 Tax=Rathayibacter festucae DSM 15932 TaxID=1328866 RepID=A0A3Q9V2I1_9MICO|nr:hypothetical protein C1I64_19475 [Rathayibacter festucae DSM 15932]
MSSSSVTDRVDEHRAVLLALTTAGGAIGAESPHASQRNAEWFDQETRQPLPGRDTAQREMIRALRAGAPDVRRDREAVLLAGPPGAGKTTALDELLASTRTTAADWRILNADDVKDLLLRRALEDGSYESHLTPPDLAAVEADGGKVWPRERAALVHEESSMVMKRVRDQSVRRGENVVVDGTLANADAGRTLVERLEGQGYRVRVVLVDGPRAVTEARVADRWARGYRCAVDGIADPGDPDLLVLGGRWVPAQVTDALYRDGDDSSICTSSARVIAESSAAVTQLDVYRIGRPSGTPELVERRIGKHEDGRWIAVERFGPEELRSERGRRETERREIP